MTLSEQLKSLVDRVGSFGDGTRIWDQITAKVILADEVIDALPTILAALEAVENTHD